jgi:hypothetical protein
MFESALPIRCLQCLAKADHLLVKRVAGKGLAARLRPHPVDSVILDQAGCDFGEHLRPEKGDQMILDSPFVILDVFGAALAASDHLELIDELSSGLFEGFARFELASLGLALQAQIPIFGDVFGLCQTFLLRAAPPLLTANPSKKWAKCVGYLLPFSWDRFG